MLRFPGLRLEHAPVHDGYASARQSAPDVTRPRRTRTRRRRSRPRPSTPSPVYAPERATSSAIRASVAIPRYTRLRLITPAPSTCPGPRPPRPDEAGGRPALLPGRDRPPGPRAARAPGGRFKLVATVEAGGIEPLTTGNRSKSLSHKPRTR